MKKCMVVAAVLAAVLIALTGCPNPAHNAPAEYTVTFSIDNDTNGTLSTKANGETITSGTKVTEGKTVVFTAEPKANYTATWSVTGGAFEAGTGTYGSTTAKVKVASDVTVKVSFLKLHKVDATLSVYAPLMNLDLAKGQPDKGEKFKPIVEGCQVTVDGDGKRMITVKFRKSYVNVKGLVSNTFIDPRNSKPGYYDMDGIKQDAPYTVSTDDTADDPEGEKVHYVTSMTFPVSKDKTEYFLWLYLNSSVMGAQSGDGKGTAGPNEPNEHSKYAGKFTVDWSTLTEE